MPREHRRRERTLGHRGRPLRCLVERADHLGAALFDHVFVEAGFAQRQPQQLEALLAIGRQDAQTGYAIADTDLVRSSTLTFAP